VVLSPVSALSRFLAAALFLGVVIGGVHLAGGSTTPTAHACAFDPLRPAAYEGDALRARYLTAIDAASMNRLFPGDAYFGLPSVEVGTRTNRGDGVAAVMLGIMHSRGLHGIRPDPCLALDWYEASELLGAPIPMEQLRSEIRPSAQRQC